jgi:hypothetical protein
LPELPESFRDAIPKDAVVDSRGSGRTHGKLANHGLDWALAAVNPILFRQEKSCGDSLAVVILSLGDAPLLRPVQGAIG